MGSKCPKCKKFTLFKTPTGVKCNNPDCTYQATTPANDGKGGKGTLCPVCKKYMVFHGVCRNCGTHEV